MRTGVPNAHRGLGKGGAAIRGQGVPAGNAFRVQQATTRGGRTGYTEINMIILRSSRDQPVSVPDVARYAENDKNGYNNVQRDILCLIQSAAAVSDIPVSVKNRGDDSHRQQTEYDAVRRKGAREIKSEQAKEHTADTAAGAI